MIGSLTSGIQTAIYDGKLSCALLVILKYIILHLTVVILRGERMVVHTYTTQRYFNGEEELLWF